MVEGEKNIKSLRYSTMEHSTFEGAFTEICHHRVIPAEESFSVLLKIFQFCHLTFCW